MTKVVPTVMPKVVPTVMPKVVPTVIPTLIAYSVGKINNRYLDPDELKKQRQKVQAIRESLPAFDEGL